VFVVPKAFQDPVGRAVDHGLLGRFLGAAFDGCDSCADTLLVLLGEDAVTTARLVELSVLSARPPAGRFHALCSSLHPWPKLRPLTSSTS
jgi:hypothetical protein